MRDDDTIAYSAKSESQKKQYHKKKAAESRQRKKDQESIAEGASCKTREEWWALNRSKMSEADLKEALDLHERCLDEVYWIQHGQEVSPDDEECYVGLDEGINGLIEFIAEHPCPRLGYRTAGDLPPDWGRTEYWKSPEMLSRIAFEGDATLLYARTGLLSGVPDWMIWNLLTEEPEHFLEGSDIWTGKPWWILGHRAKDWTTTRIGLLVGMSFGKRDGIDAHVLRYR
jgi:hypothetical protein